MQGWLKTFQPGKPVIAAVEGFALAGGTEILQGTDIRVAAESANFGITEVQRSLFPMAGSTVRLPRQMPYSVALELLLARAGSIPADLLDRRTEAWREAYRSTPHGQPVQLAGDRSAAAPEPE